MVIFYDLETKDILYTEQERMIPVLPIGTTEEKVRILSGEGKGFVGVPYEADEEINNYKVVFSNGKFIGVQPKSNK